MGIERLKEMISDSSNIVFFGGAGTSTESSIPDFRSDTGIYNTINEFGHSPEIILSHTFFMNHTQNFYRFYRSRMIYKDAQPNPAHLALAELEKKGRLRAVITQNIDGLHQLAGSVNVLEIHGSVYRNYCMKCGEKYGLDHIINSPEDIPICSKCNGIIKPDVVLYEEQLDMDVWNKAVSYVSKADILIVGGTSLAVYPAASLIDYYRGGKLVLINKSSTLYDYKANIAIHDSIGKVLNRIL